MRVVVTRAGEGIDRLAGRLREAGLDVAECPLVRIEPLVDRPRAGGAALDLGDEGQPVTPERRAERRGRQPLPSLALKFAEPHPDGRQGGPGGGEDRIKDSHLAVRFPFG